MDGCVTLARQIEADAESKYVEDFNAANRKYEREQDEFIKRRLRIENVCNQAEFKKRQIEDLSSIWYVPLLNADITKYKEVLQQKFILGIDYLKSKLEQQL